MTYIPPVQLIQCGHFRQLKNYHNLRKKGTTDWLLFATFEGCGKILLSDGRTYMTKKNEFILFKPGTLQNYGLPREKGLWDFVWAHFYPRQNWADLLHWPEIDSGILCLDISNNAYSAKMKSLLIEMNNLVNGHLKRKEMLAMNCLEQFLIWAETGNPFSDEGSVDLRIQQVLNYICEHLQDLLTIDILAEQCDLSTSRFAHLFTETVSLTPMKFIESMRITKARQLLEMTQNSIAEIAEQTGFSSVVYFTARFSELVKTSPAKFRKNFLKEDS